MANFIVTSPATGKTHPLEQVPDPAFAEKMLGDGLAVEPTSPYIVAPFEGTVTSLHQALHAITLKHEQVEILIHIGIESVALKGKGFKALVQNGQTVKQGDKLIEFDPEFLTKNTPCNWVITVVTSPDGTTAEKTTQNPPILEEKKESELLVKVKKLIADNGITVEEVEAVVTAKGHYPAGKHLEDYTEDFVARWIIPNIKKIVAQIKLEKEKTNDGK